MRTRVCVIGSGPCGMSIACNYDKLLKEGVVNEIDLTIYEKQDKWGGLWNMTWQTGVDSNGEPVHGSMYKNLWTNGPKEVKELPDYTFEEHFGKSISSFPSREVILNYLEGRWKKHNAHRFVQYEHIVRNVYFNSSASTFSVIVYDVKNDKIHDPKEFDYVVNATGHFSFPNIPSFKGIETFPGRVLHSHDFRHGEQFAGMRLLVIGAALSAEDISLQCQKFGAKRIVCSYRSNPMGFKWPANLRERPLLVEIQAKKCIFLDGESEEFDAIIMATGYIHNYPWMQNNLRISKKEPNTYFVNNLYKGLLWLGGGANRLIYMGAQNQCYTFTLFDTQAFWIVKFISGLIPLPSHELMMKHSISWKERLNEDVKSFPDIARYQLEYILDLNKDSKYPYELDCTDMFIKCLDDKKNDILTYRDKQFQSIFTKTKSPMYHTKWIDAFDDSLDAFLKI
ncbi:trimethylamine monooxygenase [Lepeophtheirus salmonis]|uniref:trimethylamine monooxygenase n=1 Tax=Lepeophtheirus salmonis TaxID=72036 RepID=UPI001AE7C965|nr:senecionine N-oxygenase-like [Lepeophtheirus salmonis]